MLRKVKREGETLLDELRREMGRRRERNSRYSIRAFARDLDVDHSSLSQILRGRRRCGLLLAAQIGRKLGLTGAALISHVAGRAARLSQRILFLVSLPEFRPDSRWIADVLGASVDDVNLAVAALAREGRLLMDSPTSWRRARARRRLPFSKSPAARARKGA
jgi:plasmid maintenance system antidote protein VapI